MKLDRDSYEKAIQNIESELPFASNDIEVIKSYVTKLERENKGLKTSLDNKTYDLAHFKGYLTK
ncbi:hypothetical protein [Faecalicoccus sp.]|uniref:hypothetical protein n=1 Tax=Faecalicoccus sp. TaxID=1971758 RepID=UPI002A814700|nr:hypothetical protein [Faecalicoccus sp.]MDY5112084.1 hypothetical protein [Faecalicoccus sp.]